jgi:hypothetical protein
MVAVNAGRGGARATLSAIRWQALTGGSARAISRANVDRHSAMPTDVEPLFGLLKCPVNLAGQRPPMLGM